MPSQIIEFQIKADVFEAIEKMNEWRPIYVTLLKVCGSKQEAIAALKFLMKMEKVNE